MLVELVDLVDGFDLLASLNASQRQNAAGAIKIWEDLERYQAAINSSNPDVVIECGTHSGKSAEWFARQDVDVVTIDVNQSATSIEDAILSNPRVTFLIGDSVDPDTVSRVKHRILPNDRVMVVLDSDHNAAHVRQEIELYSPLVTAGCYLVVEDGIVRYLQSDPGWPEGRPGPLEAIEDLLVDNPSWVRDRVIESMHPATMSPAGWWRRA